jgi:DNA-binding response OmpR family regulator
MGERLSQTELASRILLVEDSDDLRSLMVFILEAEGYSVDSARTAEEGLRLLGVRRYDLVLSDYALPGRTGTWLLREAVARHLLSRMHGVIVTAHPLVRDAEGFEVIYKPLDFDAFLDRVRCYLDPRNDMAQGPVRNPRGADPSTLTPAPSRVADAPTCGAALHPCYASREPERGAALQPCYASREPERGAAPQPC